MTNDNSQWLSKYQQVEECLRGSDDDDDDNDGMIDLWLLRELSLSNGGLLDPKLRKRAWPILTQVMMTMNKTSNTSTVMSSSSSSLLVPQQASISSKDILQIQKDVKRTAWNVKAHFRSQQQMKTATSIASPNDDMNRRVTFSDDDDDVGGGRDETKKMEDGEPSTSHSNDDGNIENSNPDFHVDDNESTMSSSFTGTSVSRRSSTRNNNSKASKHEQRTITNVIVSCLRTITSSPSEQDNRFHYYTGLHDLTALIMVNVESLSISSLLLGKLSMYHLRDALRKDRVILDTAMKLIFFPLLKSIDADLFQQLVGRGVVEIKQLLAFVIYGISNWFATDIVDIATASRLIDVFLVSHPTAPIYCVIAILIHYRDTIMASSDMNDTVRRLPLFRLDIDSTATTTNTSLATMEQIISMTLSYMELYRPCLLMELNESATIWSDEVRKQLLGNAEAISMLSATPPTWCTIDMSPNEWTIIQNVIRPGTNNNDTFVMKPSFVPFLEKYPLAAAAHGCEVPAKVLEMQNNTTGSASNAKRIVLLTVFTFLTIVLVQYGMFSSSVGTPTGDNHEFVEKVSTSKTDIASSCSVMSCIETQLLESIVDASDINDVNVQDEVDIFTNTSVPCLEPAFGDSTIDEGIDMVVPSAATLDDDVFENDESQEIHDIIEDLTVESEDMPASFLNIETDLTDYNIAAPLSNVETAFEKNILNFIHHRTLIVERRSQALMSSPAVARFQDQITSQLKKVAVKLHPPILKSINLVKNSEAINQAAEFILTHGNILKDWFRMIEEHYLLACLSGVHSFLSTVQTYIADEITTGTVPYSDIESVFEQNIAQFVHYRTLKMKHKLNALIASPIMKQTRQSVASQIKEVANFIYRS